MTRASRLDQLARGINPLLCSLNLRITNKMSEISLTQDSYIFLSFSDTFLCSWMPTSCRAPCWESFGAEVLLVFVEWILLNHFLDYREALMTYGPSICEPWIQGLLVSAYLLTSYSLRTYLFKSKTSRSRLVCMYRKQRFCMYVLIAYITRSMSCSTWP